MQWQRLNVGKKLPKDEFSRIIGEVWRELNPLIIQNGFKKGGIYVPIQQGCRTRRKI